MNYEETAREVCERGMEVREWFDGFAEELLSRFFAVESGYGGLL